MEYQILGPIEVIANGTVTARGHTIAVRMPDHLVAKMTESGAG